MADEQYRWLNRDAAERLLSGKPLEAVDADTRARADRLAEALGALAAEVAPERSQDPELPGEEAALAAFRDARTTPAAHSGESGRAAEPGRVRTTASPTADAGLVRLGRPVRPPAAPGGRRARWGRPVRYGLVAAVAAGMLGGVTVAAGGGALSSFRGDEPEPSATVSAGRSPDRPLMSPSPDTEKGDRRGAWGGVSPDPSPDDSSKGDAPSGEGTGGTDEDERSGEGGQGEDSSRDWWRNVYSACRDVRDGKKLDADRRRGLEDAAGGKGGGQLKRYCEGVLAGGAGNPGSSGKKRWSAGTGAGTGASVTGGPAGAGDKGTRSGNDSDDDDDSHHGRGRDGNGTGNGTGNGNGTGHGKSRHGNGDGDGHRHGNGKDKGGKNKGHKGGQDGKGNKGGKDNGGNGHRGQFAAVTPIGFDAGPAPTRWTLTYPA